MDPLASQFPNLSQYNYASNDPVKNIDLYGLQGVGSNDFINFMVDVKVNGLVNAIGNYFNLSSLFTGSESDQVETLTKVHAAAAASEETVNRALDKIADGADKVGNVAGDIEKGALAVTAGTGGLTSEVTVPAAAIAEVVSTGAELVKAGVDLAKDGKLEDNTLQNLGVEALSFGVGKILDGGVNALKLTTKNPNHAKGTTEAVKAAGGGVIEVVEDALKKEK